MEHKIQYKTEIIEDIDKYGNKESYIQVTHVTSRRLKNEESKVISEHKYPPVPLTTKFTNLLYQDILYHPVDESCMKYLIENYIDLQLSKSIMIQCLMVEKIFEINQDLYFIIYIPHSHLISNNYILAIIKEMSKNHDKVNPIIILSYRDYITHIDEIIQGLHCENTVIRYFHPAQFTNFILSQLLND